MDVAEIHRRLEHVRGLLFTEFTVIAVVLGLLSWGVLRVCADEAQRERWLVGASVALLAWFSGWWLTAIWLAWAVAFRVALRVDGRLGDAATVVMLAGAVALPVVFVGETGRPGAHTREFTAFATNVALLRFWAWAWDRRRGGLADESLRTFGLRVLFFPTVVNGPIETSRDFEGGWPRPNVEDLRVGLARTTKGVLKLLLVGLALAPGWNAGLGAALGGPGWRLWAWGALLYGWFYLTFSAWSDVAIGIGRLCGRRVRENFDRPWLATDVGAFWRRWHVSLGVWLRDYVYVPLGGNRRARARNVLLTFMLSALWHVWGTLKMFGIVYYPVQAWGGFLLWGLLHGLGVLASSRLAPADSQRPAGRAARRTLTFLFACWAWIPFFLPASASPTDGVAALARMLGAP